MKLTENALTVLRKRYFMKNDQGEVIENWEQLVDRVATNISSGDKKKKARYAKLLDSGYFLPNSPTLMNAGNDLQQLSACFVLPVEDSMESIIERHNLRMSGKKVPNKYRVGLINKKT